MERRFIIFIVLSVAVLMLSRYVFPPPPAANQPAAKAPVAGDDVPAAGDADKIAAAPQVPPEQPLLPPAADGADQIAPPAEPEVPLQYVTLGSLDMQSGYRMLVTLTNRGAAVQRAELSSPRFRDQYDRSGYLGHLALEPVDGGGMRARTVGAGTPAANAGLKPGDVIVGINDTSILTFTTPEQFHELLAENEPQQEVSLHVVRDGGPVKTFTAKLTRRPLEVMRPEIENLRMRGATPPEGFKDPPSFLVTLASLSGQVLNDEDGRRMARWLEDDHWEVAHQDEKSVEYRRVLPGMNLELRKRYTLEPVPAAFVDDPTYPGYSLQLDVELHNLGDAPRELAYVLEGPTGLPIEGWWYAHKISQEFRSPAGLRDVAVRFEGSKELQINCSKIVKGDVEPMGQGRSLAYAGVDAQYFSAVLLPQKKSLNELWFDTTEATLIGPEPDQRTPKTYANVTCRLKRLPTVLPPGESHRDSFTVFIGPKRPALLDQYQAAGNPNYSLKDLIYYGWFAPIARAMLGVLHFFYSIVGNYGIAIMMLTVLVRGAMFPISFKQTQNMARMQALKPELDRITEKYKTDMQKKQQAMQELYRKHNINPLGGCLPMFIQLPIFIGLYRSLMLDVELRQSPLFGHWIRWCSNLAAPDMFLNWSPIMPDFVNKGIGIMGLGPYLNILPLITVGMFLITQKMSMPAPTSEQAAMQQKMMKYVTMFMAVLFYKVASGLCLYFIASSLWGITERKLLPRATTATGAANTPTDRALPAAREKSSSGTSSAGKNGSPRQKKSKSKRKR